MPTLHHSCRHTQLHTGSATNPGSADVFCGSTHVPASVPITFFLHSHMKLSCSIWPVCALPSTGLALPGLMATWSWFRSPQWSPINAEPRLNTNLSGWPLDLQGDSTWWINTAVVSTMQLIFYLIPPFHGSLLPWINTPKAPSLVSRACLRLQVQAGSQAPTAWASRSFLNPGIYQGKKCPGKAGNRALLSNSAVCLMEKRESITWRNTNKIPWENKEYFIYSGFRQPLSFCLQCSLKHFSFHTKSSYLSAVFTLVSADAAKIVRSRVLLSPRLVRLPLCNKDVIEIPSQCTRKGLGCTFCGGHSLQSQGRTRSAARLPHLESSPRGLKPEPGLPNQCCTGNNAGTLMKCKLLRFHLHRAGIKQATCEQGSQVSQVPANPFPNSSAQLGRCSKEQELKASCIFPLKAYK